MKQRVVVVFTLGIVPAAQACESGCRTASPETGQLVLYDDFSQGIRASHWRTVARIRGQHPGALVERVSDVRDQQLRFFARSAGSAEHDATAHHLRLHLRQREVSALEATMQVARMDVAGCGADDFAFSRASVGGYFFRDVDAVMDEFGDVFAVVAVGRTSGDEPQRLHAAAVVLRCTDTPCLLHPEFGGATTRPAEVLFHRRLTMLEMGATVQLRIAYDDPSGRFRFQAGGRAASYRYERRGRRAPSPRARRHVDVAHFIPKCDASAITTEVFFDDIRVGSPQ